MDKKITIQDIANIAGVAKSTVSRYLNNGYISKEKALLLDKVIQETGYKANFFAKRLKTKDSKLIGIIMPRLDSYSAGKLLMGFNLILEQHDYQALILVSDLNIKKEITNIRQLLQQGVDGIIVQSIAITKEHIKIIQNTNVPIIFTGQSHSLVKYVKIADKKAGQLMGEYIATLKHNNVVYLGVNEKDIAVGKNRKDGFIDSYLKHNKQGIVNFVQTDFSFDNAYASGIKVMAFNPTAIVCSTDNIALGLLRYLHENNINVPKDVSLASFGGYPFSNISYPSLTTLSFDYKYLGAKTAKNLLTMLKGQDIQSEFVEHMTFITRESTANNR